MDRLGSRQPPLKFAAEFGSAQSPAARQCQVCAQTVHLVMIPFFLSRRLSSWHTSFCSDFLFQSLQILLSTCNHLLSDISALN